MSAPNERTRQFLFRVSWFMSAFVLQNDGNRRGERWLSRPLQLHKRDTTISCKSRALDFLNSYELDWEHDKPRLNKLYVSRATDAVSNGELRFSCAFHLWERCMQI